MRQLHEERNTDDGACEDGEEPLFDDPSPRKKGRETQKEDEESPVDEDREATLATLRDAASTSTLPPTAGDEKKTRPRPSSPVTAVEWKALGNKHWLAGDLKRAAEAYQRPLITMHD